MKQSNYIHSKIKKLLLLLLAIFSGQVYGQDWKLIEEMKLDETITAQSIDPDGRLYIGTSSGNVHRYNPDGNESEYFSAIANFPITTISAWNRFKIFIYYQNTQEFYFLNRFNTTPIRYEIGDFENDLATLCTPGIDNSVWILSTAYNELRKYNTQTKQLQLANPLRLNLGSATYMRAFQNLVIIADPENGLYFFDQYGNKQGQINEQGISYFQISGDEMIYLQEDNVCYRNIFKPELVKKEKAPSGSFSQVIKSGDRFFFIGEDKIALYWTGP